MLGTVFLFVLLFVSWKAQLPVDSCKLLPSFNFKYQLVLGIRFPLAVRACCKVLTCFGVPLEIVQASSEERSLIFVSVSVPFHLANTFAHALFQTFKIISRRIKESVADMI